jgi:hypothetical protein
MGVGRRGRGVKFSSALPSGIRVWVWALLRKETWEWKVVLSLNYYLLNIGMRLILVVCHAVM